VTSSEDGKEEDCAAAAEGKIPASLRMSDEEKSGGYSLAPLITEAKKVFGVKHTLVWHTLSG